MNLAPWQAQLGDLVMGPDTPFEWVSLEGLDELPEIRSGDTPRGNADGDFDGADTTDGRTITFEVEVSSGNGPDAAFLAALADLRTATVPKVPTTFSVHLPGLGTRTLGVKVRRRRIPIDRGYEVGVATAVVQLRAADPLMYADPIAFPTVFPTHRGGLEFDLYTDGTTDTGYLEYGEASDTGRIVVTNPGTAPAPVQFQVAGPVAAEGFDIVEVGTDRKLRFVGPVSASSTLVLDGATGNVLIDGDADRGGQLIYRDWPVVPPGGSLELAFINLGATSSARLTAVIRPGSW